MDQHSGSSSSRRDSSSTAGGHQTSGAYAASESSPSDQDGSSSSSSSSSHESGAATGHDSRTLDHILSPAHGHSSRSGNSSIPGPLPTARLALTPDAVKDQTYFLASLSQAQLARTLFPLGPLTKPQVTGRPHPDLTCIFPTLCWSPHPIITCMFPTLCRTPKPRNARWARPISSCVVSFSVAPLNLSWSGRCVSASTWHAASPLVCVWCVVSSSPAEGKAKRVSYDCSSRIFIAV